MPRYPGGFYTDSTGKVHPVHRRRHRFANRVRMQKDGSLVVHSKVPAEQRNKITEGLKAMDKEQITVTVDRKGDMVTRVK